MRIGVIAIQGNVEEHVIALENALRQADIEAEIIKVISGEQLIPLLGEEIWQRLVDIKNQLKSF